MYKLYIGHYRKLRRMSQQELADKCELDRSYISKLEQDNFLKHNSVGFEHIENIALNLEICPDAILRYECKPSCSLYKTCKRKKHMTHDDFDDEDYHFYI